MSDVNTARPRVLVADPDPETSALIARQLEWAGYEVITTGDAVSLLPQDLAPAPGADITAARRMSPLLRKN